MLLRITPDRNLKRGDLADARREFSRIGIATNKRNIFLTNAGGRVTTQGHDVTYPGVPVIADDAIAFFPRCFNTR